MKKIISLVERIELNYYQLNISELNYLAHSANSKNLVASFILGLVFMKEGNGIIAPNFNDDPSMEFFNQGIELIKFSAENGHSVAVPVLNYFFFELDMSNRGKQNPHLIDEQDAICREKILDQDIYDLFNECE